MIRLYQAAKEAANITGQSALARALDESPQTVKNWESRGLSKRGALKAQELFGVMATDLLGEGDAPLPTTGRNVIQVPERIAPWPFKSVTPKEWASLSAEQRLHVENAAVLLLATSPPSRRKIAHG